MTTDSEINDIWKAKREGSDRAGASSVAVLMKQEE